jgi:hypothetical protein
MLSSEARFIIVDPCFSRGGLHDRRLFDVSGHHANTTVSVLGEKPTRISGT